MTQQELLDQIDLRTIIRPLSKKILVENETGNMRGACFIFTEQDLWKLVEQIAVAVIQIEADNRLRTWTDNL